MAIVSFWSEEDKESGQTLSIAAVATYMAIEHNYRILLINATFNDDTLERCFWSVNNKKNIAKIINQGKVDIASGPEGLISAIASNKTSPEIIANYTKVLLKNRLDVLVGLKTKIFEDHEKSLMLYKDLVGAANKYYDLVFVDLSKTLKRDTTRALLDASSLIVYTMPQNMMLIDSFIENRNSKDLLKKDNLIPLLTNSDDSSKYNVRNVTRYIGEKKIIGTIPYNSVFMENACEAGVANFLLKTKISKSSLDKNSQFIESVEDVCKRIIYKLQELQYKM